MSASVAVAVIRIVRKLCPAARASLEQLSTNAREHLEVRSKLGTPTRDHVRLRRRRTGGCTRVSAASASTLGEHAARGFGRHKDGALPARPDALVHLSRASAVSSPPWKANRSAGVRRSKRVETFSELLLLIDREADGRHDHDRRTARAVRT